MRTLLAVLLFALVAGPIPGADPKELPRSTPEAQGIPSAAIRDFVNAAEASVDALHSIMIVRHGHVVAEGWWEPYRREDPHELYSLSKSFTSTAVGLAIAEGYMSLDDTVISYFPEHAPENPSDNLKAMRIRDLLRMNTGHHKEDLEQFQFFGGDRPLSQAFLELPVAHKPGTHFAYNTPATYMLSAIVQKATGQTVLDYLGPRLFEPLGIDSPIWPSSADGVTLGGFGLSITTEDIARFGLLYLQKGLWRGEQLVPADWVVAATSLQTSNGSNPDSDWDQGYGYQFWRTRHDLYRGDGAFGQFCIVMDKQDAVVAITSATRDLGGVMSLVWKHLLPAMGEDALPRDDTATNQLVQELASLSLPPQSGDATSPMAKAISGKRYALPENQDEIEAIGLDTMDGLTSLVVSLQGNEWPLAVAYGGWQRGSVLPTPGDVLNRAKERPAAGTGAWTAEDTFEGRICLYESVFCTTFKLRFGNEQVHFDHELNVAFGPTERPRLVGKMIER